MTDYRLLTFQTNSGARAGYLVDDTVHDLAQLSGNPAYATVLGVLDDWAKAQGVLDELYTKAVNTSGKLLNDVKLTAPILYPPTIYCAGANYSDHMANMAKIQNIPVEPDPHTLGLHPWHFIKVSRCAVANNEPVKMISEKLDWEAELGAVIGTKAQNVPLEKALDYVAFYTIGNDLSARDMTARPHIAVQSPFKYDWIGQKVFDGACPMGPWLVPAEEIGDPQKLAIKLWVNGQLKQDSNTAKMIFNTAEQIAHLSSRITLYPGDVILTGTPSGVGAETGVFLKRGDQIKITIERIGDLETKIV
ncbi:MAG TPA: fumarylacetoacetate hydrolase family protein [Stellaceae bacterium]|jgi:2-keto-4-pentenoate hydratase/2-oxohepta-3-ene-1,7-dioic acid hydratase in catechol pathway|nr:fumarylacetoacetate hydrolase family protein [Stellaceae bacterium]